MKDHNPTRWCVGLGASLVLTALALVLGYSLSAAKPPGTSPSRAQLASAIGPVRLLKGRLSGLKYLPMEFRREYFRGRFAGLSEWLPPIDPTKAHEIAAFDHRVQSDYEKDPSSQVLGDEALLVFFQQRPDRLETALSFLEAAVEEAPRDARLWSDLAAGYLASTRPEPPNRCLAVAAAGRAVQEDSKLPEARFNLALALENCSLFRQARRAWEEYLRLDPASGWAKEAQKHLGSLLRNHLSREQWNDHWRKEYEKKYDDPKLNPNLAQFAREVILEEILGSWASLLSEGHTIEAKRKLDSAERLGRMFLKGSSDKTAPDAVAVILAASGTAREDFLEVGHLAYQRGAQYWHAGRLDLAAPQMEVAAKSFHRAGSPLEHWANAALAEVAYHQSDTSKLNALLEQIRARANLTRYSALNARLFWLTGLSLLSRSYFLAAQREFRSAETAASLSREFEFSGAMDMYVAESAMPGSPPDWFHLHEALYQFQNAPESSYLPGLFRNFARAYEDYPEVAYYFLAEALEDAAGLADQSVEIDALIDRSLLNIKEGNSEAARQDLLVLQEKMRNVGDPIRRRELDMRARLVRCQIWLGVTPAECVTSMTEALSFYERHDRTVLPDVYRIRSDSYRRLAHYSAQEVDILKGIQLYEEGAVSLLFRHKKADDLFDKMVALQLSRGDLRNAFEFEDRSEAARLPSRRREPQSRSVFSGYSGCNLRPYSAQEFSRGLPAHTTLIEYDIADDLAAAWIFRGESVRHVALSVTRKQLVEALKPPPPGQIRVVYPHIATDDLSRWLLAPIHRWLPREGDLLFVTPPVLDSVGFCALVRKWKAGPLCNDCGIGIISKGADFSLRGNLSLAVDAIRKTLTHDTPPAGRSLYSNSYVSPEEIQRDLPASTTLIKYTVLGDRLLIWVVRRDSIQLTRLSMRRQELEKMAQDYRIQLRRSRTGEKKLSEYLYRLLLKPVEDYLPGRGDLVFIPDQALTRLPFAALTNPKTGRYIIDDYSISVAPSASLYLRQLDDNHGTDHKRWSAVVVSERDADGSYLKGATSEALDLGQVFPGSEFVSKGRDRLHPVALGQHEIVHFAGHWDPAHPTYDASLAADELPVGEKTRLVVLAACNTMFGHLWRSAGGYGLAAPLLARGVPAVVASLWGVEDQATSQLVVRFYQHLREGKDGANALRAAQLDLLHGDDPTLRAPAKWAGLQFLGFGGI